MTAKATTHPTRRWSAVLAAMLAALVAALLPAQPAQTQVVVTTSRALSDAVAAVTAAGGNVVEQLAPFGTLVARVPETQVGALTADPRTAAVSPDVAMHLQSADHVAESLPPQPATATVDAPDVWKTGDTGQGVGVVLVDSGISTQAADLKHRVVAKIDLTDEQDGNDHYGHGTFLAGLIAGDGSASGGQYTGVAPGAHLVSVKVANASGDTTLSRVMQGLVAADRARELYDAPVVVLALAGPEAKDPDPLMIALEMLWARGSTVVVASGNDGHNAHSVGSPGADPYVITVGADDDAGTATVTDDTVPAWSGRGPTQAGFEKPDVVAPAVHTVGLRAPGSTIDTEHPDARVGDHYFKGTGTSMATAVTAGAAALLLAAHPGLSPDQVKGRLTDGASPLDASSKTNGNASGAGVVNAATAIASTAGPANTDLAALPTPTDDPTAPPTSGDAGPAPEGWSWTADDWAGWSWTGWSWTGWSWTAGGWAGWSWTDAYWAGWSWTGWSWTDQHWSGWSWTGWSWTGWSWTGWSWTSSDWTDATWDGWSWTGGEDWAGWSWTGDDLSGWSWTDGDWAGWSWTGWSWTGWSWTGWSWTTEQWA